MVTATNAASSPNQTSSSQPLSLQASLQVYLETRFPKNCAKPNDNVGLTVHSLKHTLRGETASILLTVDLTEQVLADAILHRVDFVVTYYPMPSQPIHSLSDELVQGRILLRCAQHQIAVHSIHSACDSASGGVNDWLAQSLAPGVVAAIIRHPKVPDAGEGRLLECREAMPLSSLIQKVKSLLNIKYVRLALGAKVDEQSLAKAQESCYVKTVAIQVGNGAQVLQVSPLANVYLTSEMSHAEVSAATAKGIIVILTGQSTIERAYMNQLRNEIESEFTGSDWDVKVRCSEIDCYPIMVV